MRPTIYNNQIAVQRMYADVKQDLQTRGLQLDQAVIAELIQTQKQACKQYEMIEFETRPIHLIITTFMYSPYLTQDRFLIVLKNAVYTYYAIQSKKTLCCYDDEVIQIIYRVYLDHHGIFDTAIVHEVLKQMEHTTWDK